MVFNSLAYAAFLPLAVVLCFLAPARRRWAVLLALSCLFYAWADPRLLLLLGADVAVGYGAGRALGALRRPAARRGVLAAGAALMLAVDWAHERGHRLRHALAARPLPLRWAVYVGAVLLVMIFGAYGDNYEPAAFIYAQF